MIHKMELNDDREQYVIICCFLDKQCYQYADLYAHFPKLYNIQKGYIENRDGHHFNLYNFRNGT